MSALIMLHFLYIFILCLSLSFFFSMGSLRVGSLNMNGGRDRQKREMVKEVEKINKLDVIFLQETHSTMKDEVDWGLSWGGQIFLNHGRNVSGGVAILFSCNSKINVLSSCDLVKGRGQMVKANIEGSIYCFINIYAPNIGTERVDFFNNIKKALELNDFDYLILGGDWNCTVDFNNDRLSEEPHLQSSRNLKSLLVQFDLIDAWRIKFPNERQYTWVKIVDGRVSAARLDRFYLSQGLRSKLTDSVIRPVGFSDHHLITVTIFLKQEVNRSQWHFNNKLLQDETFCGNFKILWQKWKEKQLSFESLNKWWEVGKAQIRIFCQQYTSFSSVVLKQAIKEVEEAIRKIENDLLNGGDAETMH